MKITAAVVFDKAGPFKIEQVELCDPRADELLVEVSRRLRNCVRHSEQVMEGNLDMNSQRVHRTLEAVGRLGADEFVVLLPEVADEAEAMETAASILESLREPMMASGQECFITASVGISVFPAHGLTVADLRGYGSARFDFWVARQYT